MFSSGATIPLPLVLITKEFEWRHESSLIRHTCLFTNFRLKRLTLEDINGQQYFGEEDWRKIKDMATKYNGSEFKVRRPPDFVPHDIYKELDGKKRKLPKETKNLPKKTKNLRTKKRKLLN